MIVPKIERSERSRFLVTRPLIGMSDSTGMEEKKACDGQGEFFKTL
jgi:hypothetical protein